MSVRQLLNLPSLTVIIEKRKQKFIDRLLQLDYFGAFDHSQANIGRLDQVSK